MIEAIYECSKTENYPSSQKANLYQQLQEIQVEDCDLRGIKSFISPGSLDIRTEDISKLKFEPGKKYKVTIQELN